jgi:hypothetical protein
MNLLEIGVTVKYARWVRGEVLIDTEHRLPGFVDGEGALETELSRIARLQETVISLVEEALSRVGPEEPFVGVSLDAGEHCGPVEFRAGFDFQRLEEDQPQAWTLKVTDSETLIFVKARSSSEALGEFRSFLRAKVGHWTSKVSFAAPAS